MGIQEYVMLFRIIVYFLLFSRCFLGLSPYFNPGSFRVLRANIMKKHPHINLCFHVVPTHLLHASYVRRHQKSKTRLGKITTAGIIQCQGTHHTTHEVFSWTQFLSICSLGTWRLGSSNLSFPEVFGTSLSITIVSAQWVCLQSS